MDSQLANRRHSIQNIVFAMLFFLGISLHWMAWIFKWQDLPSAEKRLLADAPKVTSVQNLVDYPRAAEQYINDHYFSRNRLTAFYYSIRIHLLKEIYFPSVVLGKEKWLYFSGESNLDDYQRANPFTDKQMNRLKQYLDSLNQELKMRGVTFLVVIAPDKEGIYPENLPDDIRPIGNKSRLDYLIEYFNQHADTKLIDLRPALLNAKTKRQVYYRSDTHWNDYGTLAVYQTLLNLLEPRYPVLQAHQLDEYTVQPQDWSGDLTNFLALQRGFAEQTDVLIPSFALQAREIPTNIDTMKVYEVADNRLPRMMLYHDSFGLELIPFLAEHFQRSIYRSTRDVDLALVSHEKADIVILEVVERWLDKLLFLAQSKK